MPIRALPIFILIEFDDIRQNIRQNIRARDHVNLNNRSAGIIHSGISGRISYSAMSR
jgi:hypothetical protein